MSNAPKSNAPMNAVLDGSTALRRRLKTDPPGSARTVILRGLTSFVLLWQAIWIAADPALWPGGQSTVGASVATSMVVVAWLAFVISQVAGRPSVTRFAGSLDVLVVAVAAVVLLWTSRTNGTDPHEIANMVVLAVGVAGLTWPLRAASMLIVSLIAVEVMIAASVAGALGRPLAWWILLPAFAVAVGVISTMARYLLVRSAVRTDQATAATWEAVQARREAEAIEAAANEQERLLHDTVLNTLTAIERGAQEWTEAALAALHRRCREGAQILQAASGLNTARELKDPNSIVNAELDAVVVDLMSQGVVVRTGGDSLADLPDVYQAINVVNLEALRNVLRHASATQVQARIFVDPGPPVRVVDEIVDDGVGFDPNAVSGRLGIERSIKRTMRDIGGRAEVMSEPGHGTTIRATWTGAPSQAKRLMPLAPVFAMPVLATMGIYAVIVLAIGQSAQHLSPGDAYGFALFMVLAALVIVAAKRATVTWWTVGVVALTAPMIAALPGASFDGSMTVDWSSSVINVLFLVVIALGPRYAWLLLVPVWLLVQGYPDQELLSSGTAVLAAGALFSRSFRRNVDRYEEQLRLREQERIEIARAQTSVRRTRRRYRALRASGAVDLLEAIANGTVSPSSPMVRAQAALEERYIRTVVRIDPGVDELHAVVTTLAIDARARGVVLEVNLSNSAGIRADEVRAARPSWAQAVAHAMSGEVVRFTAQREGDRLVVRLVAPIPVGERGEMARLDVPGVMVDPGDPTDPHLMWESAFVCATEGLPPSLEDHGALEDHAALDVTGAPDGR